MMHGKRLGGAVVVGVAAACALAGVGWAGPGEGVASKGAEMTKQTAAGAFEVNLTPQADGEGVGDPSIGRLAIDKQFHGDLEAVSKGQMLGVRSADTGSGGYVALERVVGKLAGREGSFVLQHSSTMKRGAPTQSVTVVPDSGTGGLTGLVGEMTIEIEGGKHGYRFEYGFEEPGDG